jgi:hypothetical protein
MTDTFSPLAMTDTYISPSGDRKLHDRYIPPSGNIYLTSPPSAMTGITHPFKKLPDRYDPPSLAKGNYLTNTNLPSDNKK